MTLAQILEHSEPSQSDQLGPIPIAPVPRPH